MSDTYNDEMAMSYVMKVSRNGQVSIPSAARARWAAERVVVVDLGDRVVLRPVRRGGVDDLVGQYAGTGPSTEALRAAARSDETRRGGRGPWVVTLHPVAVLPMLPR